MENQNTPQKEPNLNPEPVVLGHLKKDSTGNMGFIVIIFVLLLSIFLAWPYVHTFLQEDEGWLGQLYDRFFGEEPDEQAITNNTIHLLGSDAHIIFDDINITNVRLGANAIVFYIRTNEEEPVNLSEDTLYFEIMGADERIIRRVKLTGIIGNENEEMSLVIRPPISFNPDVAYYGRVQRLTEEDYDEIELGEEQTLTCTFDYSDFIYTFEDDLLISLVHNFRARVNDNDLEAHIERLRYYEAFANAINLNENSTASAEETSFGVEFTAYISLYGFELEGDFPPYHFHEFERSANRVRYQMIAQGFECR